MNVEKLRENLEQRGYRTSYFETAGEAAAYLNEAIHQTTVGMGGSVTIQEMGLYDSLSAHNEVFWHWAGKSVQEAEGAKVYLTSVNGLAETGELINIDGNDFDEIRAALKEARETKGMPTAIIAKTIKGKGVSFMEDQAGWHGKAPNDEEYRIAMDELEKAGEALCRK